MRSVFPPLILTFLPFLAQAQNPLPAPPNQQQTQLPAVQTPAVTDEQVRAWLLQSLQPKQVLPAAPSPLPSPALPTAEQLAQFEKWSQSQKQQATAAAAPAQPAAQTAAQALAQYQSCIASEKARLNNGQPLPASTQNQINNTSAGLSKKTGGLFDLNEMLRQMRIAGIEAKATKNCKALAPPATAVASKP